MQYKSIMWRAQKHKSQLQFCMEKKAARTKYFIKPFCMFPANESPVSTDTVLIKIIGFSF